MTGTTGLDLEDGPIPQPSRAGSKRHGLANNTDMCSAYSYSAPHFPQRPPQNPVPRAEAADGRRLSPAPTWAHQKGEGTLAPAAPEFCTHTGPSEKGEGTLAPAVPKSCTHTGPSEKGEGTLAHLVSGLLSGLLLSKRGFLQKGEDALRKEELARDPKYNKHLPLSSQTPTSKIIHRTTQY